jgi:hypothetical protein
MTSRDRPAVARSTQIPRLRRRRKYHTPGTPRTGCRPKKRVLMPRILPWRRRHPDCLVNKQVCRLASVESRVGTRAPEQAGRPVEVQWGGSQRSLPAVQREAWVAHHAVPTPQRLPTGRLHHRLLCRHKLCLRRRRLKCLLIQADRTHRRRKSNHHQTPSFRKGKGNRRNPTFRSLGP